MQGLPRLFACRSGYRFEKRRTMATTWHATSLRASCSGCTAICAKMEGHGRRTKSARKRHSNRVANKAPLLRRPPLMHIQQARPWRLCLRKVQYVSHLERQAAADVAAAALLVRQPNERISVGKPLRHRRSRWKYRAAAALARLWLTDLSRSGFEGHDHICGLYLHVHLNRSHEW